MSTTREFAARRAHPPGASHGASLWQRCWPAAAIAAGLVGVFLAGRYAETHSGAVAILLLVAASLPFAVLQALANRERTITGLRRIQHRQRCAITHLSTHDPLTGLPAMNLVQDRLDSALRSMPRRRRKVALLVIDLDHFGDTNMDHGRAACDRVLKALAVRLKEALRSDDTVGRRGSDEFVIVLAGVTDAESALAVADALRAAISAPLPVDDQHVTLAASLGLAVAPDHGVSADELIDCADQAVREAKRGGRNRLVLARTGDARSED